MIGKVCSGGVHGIEAFMCLVECDISGGFPGVELVGSLAPEVKESKERVITALKNCGFIIPAKRITVNISPANLKKRGTGYDLPVAISILIAMGEIEPTNLDETLVIGELLLSGEVGPVKGVLPIVKMARDRGIKRCIVPKANYKEASVVDDVMILPADSLASIVSILLGEKDFVCFEKTATKTPIEDTDYVYDFSSISGQKVAKRGLEIGAAGLHNVLMIGPPGTGKTLLAKSLAGILPPMNKDESLEVSSIYSVAGLLPSDGSLITKRPVVEAHHTSTEIALSGGGNMPHPGLISLAHRGVLFLDEMPEFSSRVLEVLRQPIEDRVIHIARNGYNVSYPADFMLVGALNPCPCGMYPDMKKCTCTENMRRRYIGKLSKPLVDRMDLCVQVLRPNSNEMLNSVKEESSLDVRNRVIAAQKIQRERFEGTNVIFNSQMGIAEIEKFCCLGNAQKELMEKAILKYDLSARSYHRILRSARTIADLDRSDEIKCDHITEALFFKSEVLS